MNVIVFGANGTVGIEIVKQALAKGYHTTAFVRNADKLKLAENPRLTIHQGDVLQVESVRYAIKNQDVVFCALGDGKVGKIRAAGTQNIITVMQSEGVQRLICQSTIGAGNSYKHLNFVWKYIMFGFLLKKVLPDHNLQEQFIEKSSLNYTIIRPSALTNGEKTNNYKVDIGEESTKLTLKISRKDVAHFMLNQIENNEFNRKAVNISH
ncbi:NAD(P)-dependent oxidoreductase [Chryseobacterium sp.]|uniref:NAD(P)-dependent oxidoreductase n=1 Tax=Chryseobacterium sp. TaxID=1871047 RepID=UPI00388F05DF